MRAPAHLGSRPVSDAPSTLDLHVKRDQSGTAPVRFGLLPKSTNFQITSMITG